MSTLEIWPLWAEESLWSPGPFAPKVKNMGRAQGAHLVVIVIQAGLLTLQLNHLHFYHPVLLFSGHEVSIGVWLPRPGLLGWWPLSQEEHPFRPAHPTTVNFPREWSCLVRMGESAEVGSTTGVLIVQGLGGKTQHEDKISRPQPHSWSRFYLGVWLCCCSCKIRWCWGWSWVRWLGRLRKKLGLPESRVSAPCPLHLVSVNLRGNFSCDPPKSATWNITILAHILLHDTLLQLGCGKSQHGRKPFSLVVSSSSPNLSSAMSVNPEVSYFSLPELPVPHLWGTITQTFLIKFL